MGDDVSRVIKGISNVTMVSKATTSVHTAV
jgi:hypothetical protein